MNRDGEIVTLLSLGMTRAQVADRLDIGERTVYRRLKDPEFQAQLDAARDVYQSAPPELKRLYRILEDLRSGLRFLDGLDSSDLELTMEEARRHLANAVRWAEELCWLKEQDEILPDPPEELTHPDPKSAVNLVSEVYEHQTHGDTCTCVLGEAAA